MPVVVIPEAYRGPTKGVGEVRVEVGTVRDCLERVETLHDGFLELVLNGDGSIHRFVKLFLNGEQLEDEKLDLEVGDGDQLEILAAIAGG